MEAKGLYGNKRHMTVLCCSYKYFLLNSLFFLAISIFFVFVFLPFQAIYRGENTVALVAIGVARCLDTWLDTDPKILSAA